jgi:hypothetical protein
VGLVRGGAFVLLTAGVAAAIAGASVASCTHGSYDGSFDSAGLDIVVLSSDALAPPVTKTVPASASGTTTVVTGDSVFEVDVPAHAFAVDVTITIAQQADRTIDNGFVVPVYDVRVAPDGPATLPVQVIFRGSNPGNTGPNNALVPVTLQGNATTLLGVLGSAGNTGGPSQATLWALTTRLAATYTLAYVHDLGTSGSNQLQEPSSSNCLLTCCGVNKNGGTGSGQLYATDVGCACAFSNPNLDCFARSCPDIAAAAQRCLDLRAVPNGSLACQGSGPGCIAPGNTCCYARGTGLVCSGPNGTTGPSNQPCTYVERCTDDSQCNASGVCCAFDDEALCSTACPPDRRVCVLDGGACEGGASCAKAANCSIGTCGAPPSACR